VRAGLARVLARTVGGVSPQALGKALGRAFYLYGGTPNPRPVAYLSRLTRLALGSGSVLRKVPKRRDLLVGILR
jgi:hypothetical protein